MRPWRITTALLGISLLAAPAFVAGQAAPYEQTPPGQAGPPATNQYDNNIIPDPGTVNYVEGAVYLDGQALGKNSVGTTEMAAGQVLQTHQGKAEILLNPGIYLRVGDHSTIKMISPSITPTQVTVLRGRVSVEVDQLLKQNVVQIMDHGVTTQLVKTGYYEFSANGRVKVFKGRAEVEYANNRWAEVKGHHAMILEQGVKEKDAKFQADPQEDQLMQWSKLRSEYLAEANQQMAPEFDGSGYYPGWYWDPYMWDYTFIGGGPFYSPFGWGFYPLGWGWGGGFYGGGFYGGGFYGRGLHGHGFYGGRGFHGVGGGRFRGGTGGGSFHGGMGGFHGDMGGGGFHGDMGGGGFHGGGGRR